MSPLPRVQQALHTVEIDAAHPARGPVFTIKELDAAAQSGGTSVLIEKLWNDKANKTVVDAFMNNTPCQSWSRQDDEQLLPSYQDYAIQDYFYLIDYVKFKALRLTTIPVSDFDTLKTEAESAGKAPGYVTDWAKVCTDQLSVDPQKFKSTDRSVAELAYANYLQNNASINDWFNLHIIMIACTYGWSKLAIKLNQDQKTKKNNLFYKTWIKPNLNQKDPSKLNDSAVKLATFLDANEKIWASQNDVTSEWGELFRTGLRLELALFQASQQSKMEGSV